MCARARDGFGEGAGGPRLQRTKASAPPPPSSNGRRPLWLKGLPTAWPVVPAAGLPPPPGVPLSKAAAAAATPAVSWRQREGLTDAVCGARAGWRPRLEDRGCRVPLNFPEGPDGESDGRTVGLPRPLSSRGLGRLPGGCGARFRSGVRGFLAPLEF